MGRFFPSEELSYQHLHRGPEVLLVEVLLEVLWVRVEELLVHQQGLLVEVLWEEYRRVQQEESWSQQQEGESRRCGKQPNDGLCCT